LLGHFDRPRPLALPEARYSAVIKRSLEKSGKFGKWNAEIPSQQSDPGL